MFANLASDIRYALRTLARRPGFTAAALLTLALGIGANTAVFSVVNAVLIRPLPYAEANRLVAVWPSRFLSYSELFSLRENSRSLSRVAGLSPGWSVGLTGTAQPTQLSGARTSADLFALLGVKPLLGRTFVPEELQPGNDRVVILAHSLWRTQFGEDPAIVGSQIILDGQANTVVGVMPPEFEILQPNTDTWQPLAVYPDEWYQRGGAMQVVGRLRAGESFETAQEELVALTGRMRETFALPDSYGQDLTVVPLRRSVVGEMRTTLLVLFGAVAFTLLIAGANLGGLLLSQATGRQQEFAVRAALGASRSRLVTQQLTESSVLALAGGAAGLVLAFVGVQVLRALLPPDMPRLAEISVDGRVLAVCGLLAVASGLVFGLAPALTGTRSDLQGVLRGSRGAGISGRPSTQRVRGSLVVAEISLAMMLVIGASLMLQTLWRLQKVDVGFETANLITLRIQPTGSRFRSRDIRRTYYRQLFERLEGAPGVLSVGAIQHLPLRGASWGTQVEIAGQPLPEGETPPRIGWRIVSSGYFKAMGLAVSSGRPFTEADGPDGQTVVIVNQTMARQFWPGESPVGKRVMAGNATDGEWATIVGVVADVRHLDLRSEPIPELFRPLKQYTHGAVTLVVRTGPSPTAMVGSIREAIWSVDRDVPIAGVQSFEQVISQSVARPRLIMVLLAVFAAIGLVLGAVGIYGVVAYNVSQRTREIGIRIALGAERDSVVGLVLRGGLYLTVPGVLLGLGGAVILSRVMTSLVYEVSTTDPLTYVVITAAIMSIALLASFIPARKAAAVDPMVALRQE